MHDQQPGKINTSRILGGSKRFSFVSVHLKISLPSHNLALSAFLTSLNMPTSVPIIGHGYFEVEGPGHDSTMVLKEILKRPAVFGGAYVVETFNRFNLLYGFLLMNQEATDKEHDDIYDNLSGWCKLRQLHTMTAYLILKDKKKHMVKKTARKMRKVVVGME
ncbi:hypothetical protein SEMRO_2918_G340230.1 [Seminavis robusta]|uniref:Uncharacterized protein n=1 Tax=Seminavis robusta TaxID=568900 RepID=A0A9N8F4C4_9STRA|nr:hypothetical protein SEMRO_2918_G340230.1 [Seminavis robusta]|eukprot:Sro2918_g340230.1 n/a (162) ;mRNA; f:7721-8206